MNRAHYRTVKNNRIRLLGKTLGTESLKNGELDGQRFCFIPYKGAFEVSGMTALWGTEAYSKVLSCEPKEVCERELQRLRDESDKVLAPDGYLRWYFWEEVQ